MRNCFNYRYKITWTYSDSSVVHISFVECTRKKQSFAKIAFHRLFHKNLHAFLSLSYNIVGCEYVGEVLKKSW